MLAEGMVAAQALYASLFEPRVGRLTLTRLPTLNRDGITLLNVSRFVQMPQVLLMAADRTETLQLHVSGANADAWSAVQRSGRVVLTEMPNESHRERINVIAILDEATR